MKKMVMLSVAALAVMSLSACSNMSKETKGTLIGGAAGGAVGAVVTDSPVGAAVGAAAGGLIGHTVAKD
ncbi:MAG: hypothetical protein COV52_04165 [Gammaproteobacteria bacterium CG11_big_fil_rev_8_21_14_0_20_46_22]|nr:MAG: hypothetical protein COW05_04355 [Gammaproteobacteria bacterium CG12_big_fil_rev_8_21_14_0_65_46_12]PIR11391.1 MAG: hypothetical protein COV52_04165 [Gammaproteobacteria bacterium CG11_big_fil_rev_8_21_14_0_20_46_22]